MVAAPFFGAEAIPGLGLEAGIYVLVDEHGALVGFCIQSAFSLSAQVVPPDFANEGSIAEMFDRVLEKEFSEKEQLEGGSMAHNAMQ